MGYEKQLMDAGLSEKESKVYLASLELGPETAQNIAKKAGINRVTTYVQIESLKGKGLMSEFEKGKKTFYSAETPDRLDTLLNAMESDLSFKREELQKVIPALGELFAGAGERPKVRFYEGVEGTKAIRDEFLKNKSKKVYSFTNLDKLLGQFPKHEDEFTTKRAAAGIESFVIYTREAGKLENDTKAAQLRVTKFVPADKIPIDADIAIFDYKVSFANYKAKPVAIIIENKEIADTLRAIFNFLWSSL